MTKLSLNFNKPILSWQWQSGKVVEHDHHQQDYMRKKEKASCDQYENEWREGTILFSFPKKMLDMGEKMK